MSKYTVTIKEYVEGSLLSENWKDITNPTLFIENLTKDQILTQGRKLFPSSYEFYSDDATLKEDFEKKFIQHFYFYEIGQETIGQFKWNLEDFLNTRMPYYKSLYESKLSSLAEAMKNIDVERTYQDNEQLRNTHTDTTTDTGSVTDTGSSQSSGNNSLTSAQKQYPLNDTEIQEIGRTENAGTESASGSNTNQQTRNLTSATTGGQNNDNNRNGTSRTSGFNNINKIQSTKQYRDLIFSINELIFNDARENHLFFELW